MVRCSRIGVLDLGRGRPAGPCGRRERRSGSATARRRRAALPSTRTDCSEPAISARPPAALRLVWRSCWLTCAAVMPCACSAAGSRMTRISRSTPPSRVDRGHALDAEQPLARPYCRRTSSAARASCRWSRRRRTGSGRRRCRPGSICGSRMPSGRSPRIWAMASRTSLTARSVGVPISNWTKVLLLPSRTELLISSTPLTAADRRLDLLRDLVLHLGRRRAGLRDVDVGGREFDVRVVVDVHPHERDEPGQHQADEQDDRRNRVADAPGRDVAEIHAA